MNNSKIYDSLPKADIAKISIIDFLSANIFVVYIYIISFDKFYFNIDFIEQTYNIHLGTAEIKYSDIPNTYDEMMIFYYDYFKDLILPDFKTRHLHKLNNVDVNTLKEFLNNKFYII